MVRKVFLCLLIYFVACESTTASKEKNEITKEEQFKKKYNDVVVPLFIDYNGVNIPSDLTINKDDKTVDAGASFGYIEVSQGLIEYDKEYIKIYVLAHEVAHIVTLRQAEKFGLEKLIPSGKETNDYKKSEYLADLIAIHLINKNLPKQKKILYNDFNTLKLLLGRGDYMHPSGSERINMITVYLKGSQETSPSSSFKDTFIKIWNLP